MACVRKDRSIDLHMCICGRYYGCCSTMRILLAFVVLFKLEGLYFNLSVL